ncbi:hypothetical protein PRUPE_5G011800 [Prunus persica]|uniref:Uncharacterized protein n=1 Tax=Prunus persica TaxID=3760 RepID=A0A251P1Q7_PRUPE|nr:uncharacterized protein LOC18776664 isoform X2 [Prunus persica]ONI05537.1 hypothetical protein PRUPE_5G011800 [Prunus persica]
MRPTSESAEWIFLATNLGLEMLSAACDQASSPRRPHFALFGMLLAIAAVFISIGELVYRGKRERVVLRRRGMLWWFYHPPPPRHAPFGTLPDIYGVVAGISQCICSIVQYVYCLRHADSPFKASLLPAIFLICLVGSRLSNKRMNANTSSVEETSLHPIQEYYAPANIPFVDNQEVEDNIVGYQQQVMEPLLEPQLDMRYLKKLQYLDLSQLRYLDLSQLRYLDLSQLRYLELGLQLLPHLPQLPHLQYLDLPQQLRPKED